MTPVQTLLFIAGCCAIGVGTLYLAVPAITYICVAVVTARKKESKPDDDGTSES